jgi:hypothetical protein
MSMTTDTVNPAPATSRPSTQEKPAPVDPVIERVKTAKADLERVTGELAAARAAVRRASQALKTAEAQERWPDAAKIRAELPAMTEPVAAFEKVHAEKLSALAEAEEVAKKAALRRYEAVMAPLLSAAEKFLERVQQERLFRQQRGAELGGFFYLNSGIAQYPIFGLEAWLKEARRRAAILFGDGKR